MGTEKHAEKTSNNPLEQFVLLSKGTRGAGVVELIKQALDAPGVYVFGELLDMPHIKELRESDHSCYYELLQLFAHGTYKMYVQNAEKLPPLNEQQKKKLQHLTIVTLATKNNSISYSQLLEETDITNVRDLEDLIIEAVYADIIRGKLDQKNSNLEVDYVIGRDFKEEDMNIIIDTLQNWCDSCENVLSELDTQISRANTEKTKFILHTTDVEKEIANLEKTVQVQIEEESMPTRTFDKNKKGNYMKMKTRAIKQMSKKNYT